MTKLASKANFTMMMGMCMCGMCMFCSTIFSNALSITKMKICFQ